MNRWGVGVAWLVLLLIVGACSGDFANVGEGGAGGAAFPAPAETAPASGDTMSAGLRAAFIASVQESADERYRFETLGQGGVGARNAR